MESSSTAAPSTKHVLKLGTEPAANINAYSKWFPRMAHQVLASVHNDDFWKILQSPEGLNPFQLPPPPTMEQAGDNKVVYNRLCTDYAVKVMGKEADMRRLCALLCTHLAPEVVGAMKTTPIRYEEALQNPQLLIQLIHGIFHNTSNMPLHRRTVDAIKSLANLQQHPDEENSALITRTLSAINTACSNIEKLKNDPEEKKLFEVTIALGAMRDAEAAGILRTAIATNASTAPADIEQLVIRLNAIDTHARDASNARQMIGLGTALVTVNSTKTKKPYSTYTCPNPRCEAVGHHYHNDCPLNTVPEQLSADKEHKRKISEAKAKREVREKKISPNNKKSKDGISPQALLTLVQQLKKAAEGDKLEEKANIATNSTNADKDAVGKLLRGFGFVVDTMQTTMSGGVLAALKGVIFIEDNAATVSTGNTAESLKECPEGGIMLTGVSGIKEHLKMKTWSPIQDESVAYSVKAPNLISTGILKERGYKYYVTEDSETHIHVPDNQELNILVFEFCATIKLWILRLAFKRKTKTRGVKVTWKLPSGNELFEDGLEISLASQKLLEEIGAKSRDEEALLSKSQKVIMKEDNLLFKDNLSKGDLFSAKLASVYIEQMNIDSEAMKRVIKSGMDNPTITTDDVNNATKASLTTHNQRYLNMRKKPGHIIPPRMYNYEPGGVQSTYADMFFVGSSMGPIPVMSFKGGTIKKIYNVVLANKSAGEILGACIEYDQDCKRLGVETNRYVTDNEKGMLAGSTVSALANRHATVLEVPVNSHVQTIEAQHTTSRNDLKGIILQFMLNTCARGLPFIFLFLAIRHAGNMRSFVPSTLDSGPSPGQMYFGNNISTTDLQFGFGQPVLSYDATAIAEGKTKAAPGEPCLYMGAEFSGMSTCLVYRIATQEIAQRKISELRHNVLTIAMTKAIESMIDRDDADGKTLHVPSLEVEFLRSTSTTEIDGTSIRTDVNNNNDLIKGVQIDENKRATLRERKEYYEAERVADRTEREEQKHKTEKERTERIAKRANASINFGKDEDVIKAPGNVEHLLGKDRGASMNAINFADDILVPDIRTAMNAMLGKDRGANRNQCQNQNDIFTAPVVDQDERMAIARVNLTNHLCMLALRRAKTPEFQVGLNVTIDEAMRKHPNETLESIRSELNEIMKRTFVPVDYGKMTPMQKKLCLPSMMFIKDKYDSQGNYEKTKARLVAGGHRQNHDDFKEGVSAPTLGVTSLFALEAIAAHEGHISKGVDCPAAYLHAPIPPGGEPIFMSLDKTVSKYLVEMIPELESLVNDKGKITGEINFSLYGLIQSAQNWYNHITTTLKEVGFEVNEYEPCVWNRWTDGNITTVGIYVDDLKIYSKTEEHIDNVIKTLTEKYGKLTIKQGPIMSYLGMTFDTSIKGEVTITMEKYIKDILDDIQPEGTRPTPANGQLLEIDENSPLLPEKERQEFTSAVMKIFYLARRVRPDMLVATSFLTRRTTKATEQDKRKLTHLIQYLNGEQSAGITLRPGGSLRLYAYIDAAYGTHFDMKSHSGCVIQIGQNGGPIFCKSVKQHITSKSSTEAELIAASDAGSQLVWLRRFMIAQGHDMEESVLYQDNMSTIFMINNGGPKGQKTRHILTREYWLKDYIKMKEIVVVHCPTEDMIADALTKPLLGSLFEKMRKALLNWKGYDA